MIFDAMISAATGVGYVYNHDGNIHFRCLNFRRAIENRRSSDRQPRSLSDWLVSQKPLYAPPATSTRFFSAFARRKPSPRAHYYRLQFVYFVLRCIFRPTMRLTIIIIINNNNIIYVQSRFLVLINASVRLHRYIIILCINDDNISLLYILKPYISERRIIYTRV